MGTVNIGLIMQAANIGWQSTMDPKLEELGTKVRTHRLRRDQNRRLFIIGLDYWALSFDQQMVILLALENQEDRGFSVTVCAKILGVPEEVI